MKQENKKEYLNPYICGFLIGLLIVAFIAIMGTGFSVTEAITRIVAWGTSFINSENFKNSEFLEKYSQMPTYSIMLPLVLGLVMGGFVSAEINWRMSVQVERKEGTSRFFRLLFVSLAGIMAGFGMSYARGGLIEHSLNGFAMQNTGSFVFIVSSIISGFVISVIFWRQWND